MSETRRRLGSLLRRARPPAGPELALSDTSVPLPAGAEEALRDDHPRLAELRAAYAALDWPVLAASRWHRDAVDSFLDLRRFRGETLITWHYREEARLTELKYFALTRYVEDRDRLGLMDRLDEDGAFGCFTFDFEGHGRVSRDLLESVNEIGLLDRRGALGTRPAVLDIGAGYGRLAHRMASGVPGLVDYCCVDAVPESTFLSEYYLAHRGVTPPARVVALPEIESLPAGHFTLAVNIHSFSECPAAAVGWWAQLLERLEVPRLLIVPNEPDRLLTLEPDGSRLDFLPLLEAAGYRLDHREPVIDDAATRRLVGLEDRFFLFARGGG